MDIFASRRDRLLATLKEEELAGAIITNPVNVTYLTGFSGEASYLIVSPAQTVLISDGRFTDQLQDECPGLDAIIRPPGQSISQAAAQTLQKLGLTGVGFESGHLTVAEFQSISDQAKTVAFQPGSNRVEALRQIKDAGEIEQIRQAVGMAQKAFTMFRAMLRPGDTEKELADAMEMYVRRAGGKATAFPSIVAVAERAALPHAPPIGRAVSAGTPLLVDWGARGNFYHSDLTRVLVPRGRPSADADGRAQLEKMHQVVLRAQERAIEALRPGVKAGAVDAAARQIIAQAGYGDNFTHSIGHGIGLQVHEAPLMKPDADAVLQAGMVVTVEPGIYLPGKGGVRIEDDVLVTADGHEVLSSLPRDRDANLLDF